MLQGWALQNVVVPAASLYGMQDEYAYLRPSIKRFATGAANCDVAQVDACHTGKSSWCSNL